MLKRLLSILPVVWLCGCAHVAPVETAPRAFQYKKDTFAFANETVWDYGEKQEVPRLVASQNDSETASGNKYARRCFVMSRAAVQFWKFAKFEPAGKKLPSEELVRRIREVAGRDVWEEALPAGRRVVFPGYRSIYEMSLKEVRPLQENMGAGWTIYFRLGNWCIISPPSRAHQARTNDELQQWLGKREPMILWICNFPSLAINHAVVVYEGGKSGKKFTYNVYDPNYPAKPGRLEYNPDSRTFSFNKTFYFEGGEVAVRPVYLSPLQ